MTAAVEFGLLGPLRARVEGQPVPITSQRQLVALATLLFHPDDIVSTSTLAEAIWPDGMPAKPANQVAICMLALRRKLGVSGLIETQAPGYLVRTDQARLDTLVVDGLVAKAREAFLCGRKEESLVALRTALGCWRGPVLPGIGGGPLAAEILRWDERRISLVELCIQLELDLGHHERVIGELSALVADHGLRERPREQLMIALHRSGRQAQALSVYQVTRKMFQRELGMEPSARLREIYEAIRSGASPSTDARLSPAHVGDWR